MEKGRGLGMGLRGGKEKLEFGGERTVNTTPKERGAG